MPASLNIAIVGGGPGGLTLACILHQISISSTSNTQLSFTVFELDPSKEARSQGGMLDIHRSTGQQALKRAGVIDEFKKHMLIEATEVYIRDNTGKAHFHYEGDVEGGHGDKGDVSEVERPEIDRRALRSLLLNALPEEKLIWAKKLVSISTSQPTTDSNTKFELHFADGTSAGGFDIVVGADGAWSKVRSSANTLEHPDADDTKPPYSGISCIESWINDAKERFPHLVALSGNGSCYALSKSSGVFTQLGGDGSLRTYFMFNAPEDWKLQGQQAEGGVHQRFVPKGPFVEECLSEWYQGAREGFLEGNDENLLLRPLYEFPPGHTWKSPVPGITLLGDAAHVMTPFAGVGVNLALHDTLDLSIAIEKILDGSSSISNALGSFENDMYGRAKQNVTITFRNRTTFFGKPGPAGTSLGNEGIEKIVKVFSDVLGAPKQSK